jgi:hypothetical protein
MDSIAVAVLVPPVNPMYAEFAPTVAGMFTGNEFDQVAAVTLSVNVRVKLVPL